jgi:hypothetical protein
MSTGKRKAVESLVYKVMDALDNTGANTKKYRDMFNAMSDSQFNTWISKFLKDPKLNFRLEVLPHKNEPKFDQIEKALKILDIPMEEYVYFRDTTDTDGNPMRTATKVPVIYLSIKRLEQVVSHKSGVTLDIDKRNQITGTVTSDSKVAKNSDVESYALILQGNTETLKEIMGPRADNTSEKRLLYKKIEEDGFVNLKEVETASNAFDKVSLNTFDTFLLGAGIKSDVVTTNNMLPVTMLPDID